MKFSMAQLSRQGGRPNNEDRMGYCYTRDSALLVLADGMGGHPDGEIAAQLAVQTIAAHYQHEAQPVLRDVNAFLASAVLAAHQQILRHACDRRMPDAPRTTVVMAVLQNNTATWVHCGDSRLYVVRHGRLLMRTRDHSHIERPRALSAPRTLNRNLLLTCLGSPQPPVFEISAPLALEPGDRLMLCSDGLWAVMDDMQIVQTLARLPMTEAVTELVGMALRRGGAQGDNVTMIGLEWEPLEGPGGISTQTLGEGVYACTIPASRRVDGENDEFDDEAIERSIVEINEAIERSILRKP